MGKKVIIDTDPGYDDMLAMLYAFASSPEDIEVLLVSITFGNVDVQSCLRNALAMFHVIEKEVSWRESKGLPEGFTVLKKTKPILAVGAEESLDQQKLKADYYHGIDGLGNVHETHPHHSPPLATWSHLFENTQPKSSLQTTAESVTGQSPSSPPTLFSPSNQHSADVILSLLSSHPPDTITLIAIGPLTNYAIAASRDVSTFLRAKHLLVMGGAVDVPGNMTPVAEFNCIADPVAAAAIYALTSPKPLSTMPPQLKQPGSTVTAGRPSQASTFPPSRLARPLSLILFPLDITHPHILTRGESESTMAPLAKEGSPLAEWVSAFLEATFQTTECLLHKKKSKQSDGSDVAVVLHDPLPVWYAIDAPPVSPPTQNKPAEESAGTWQVTNGIDIRVETGGQWTRGMHVRDGRRKATLRDEIRESRGQEEQQQLQTNPAIQEETSGAEKQEATTAVLHTEPAGTKDNEEQESAIAADAEIEVEVAGDHGNWMQPDMGNRVRVCVDTPGARLLAHVMLETIFGRAGGQ